MAFIALDSAATGLSALSTSLDVIANNLANANTDGFKASRANVSRYSGRSVFRNSTMPRMSFFTPPESRWPRRPVQAKRRRPARPSRDGPAVEFLPRAFLTSSPACCRS